MNLLFPPPDMKNPVCLIHGTLDTKENMAEYEKAGKIAGYPVFNDTYPAITHSGRIEISCQGLSRRINAARTIIAQKTYFDISSIKNDPAALREFFGIDEAAEGMLDETVESLVSLLPEIIREVEAVVQLDEDCLVDIFSGKIKDIELSLAQRLLNSPYSHRKKDEIERELLCRKTASWVLDILVPRVIVVGHSMGGLVAYTVALNPESVEASSDNGGFNGEAGIGMVLCLAAPVAGGIAGPIPGGYVNYTFSWLGKIIFEPLENNPVFRKVVPNRFIGAVYNLFKATLEAITRATTYLALFLARPFVLSARPGLGQAAKGSSFMERYILGKRIPENMTVLSLHTPLDGICEEAACTLEENEKNVFNLEVDVPVTTPDLKPFFTTHPIQSHEKITRFPLEHEKEFRKKIIRNPAEMVRLLDLRNFDGMRIYCLKLLEEELEKDPFLLQRPEFEPVAGRLREVADENMPFKNTPSRLAKEILS